MRIKPTLHDLIILYLEARGGWVPSYDLEKVQTPFGWIGTSGSRRCRELAEDGTHEYKGIIYKVERRQVGKYAEYRVLSKPKPRTIYVEVEKDGQTVRVAQLVG